MYKYIPLGALQTSGVIIGITIGGISRLFVLMDFCTSEIFRISFTFIRVVVFFIKKYKKCIIKEKKYQYFIQHSSDNIF
jgi:hypothetical protein